MFFIFPPAASLDFNSFFWIYIIKQSLDDIKNYSDITMLSHYPLRCHCFGRLTSVWIFFDIILHADVDSQAGSNNQCVIIGFKIINNWGNTQIKQNYETLSDTICMHYHNKWLQREYGEYCILKDICCTSLGWTRMLGLVDNLTRNGCDSGAAGSIPARGPIYFVVFFATVPGYIGHASDTCSKMANICMCRMPISNTSCNLS